jgi:predicted acetyltransferase
MELLTPSEDNLHLYIAALRREKEMGEKPFHNTDEILAKAEAAPAELVASLTDLVGGRTFNDEDGTERVALPAFTKWLYTRGDNEISGTIQMRWDPATMQLPPYCLGHIGYQVFPWVRGKGLATEQLRMMLEVVKSELNLPYVDITTNVENKASQMVIVKNGGKLIKEFTVVRKDGKKQAFLWRVFF